MNKEWCKMYNINSWEVKCNKIDNIKVKNKITYLIFIDI